jgi:hypothetical protein
MRIQDRQRIRCCSLLLQTALAPLCVMPVLSWLMFRTLAEPAIRVPTKGRAR